MISTGLLDCVSHADFCGDHGGSLVGMKPVFSSVPFYPGGLLQDKLKVSKRTKKQVKVLQETNKRTVPPECVAAVNAVPDCASMPLVQGCLGGDVAVCDELNEHDPPEVCMTDAIKEACGDHGGSLVGMKPVFSSIPFYPG